MSRIVSFFKKANATQLNFIDKSIADSDEPDEVPVLYIDKSTDTSALPKEMHQVTPRLLLMPFPTPDLIYVLSSYLNTHYGKRYMVWNLSESTYDMTLFNNQVIDYVFVGYPNPPLDMLFATCTSMQAWLDTDPSNIAVLHCQASRSRSIMVLACFLAWTNREFPTAASALQKVCAIVGTNELSLLFPSQRRYLQYSEGVLEGRLVRSRQPTAKKLRLERVIITGIPAMEKSGTAVRPYFQVYRGQELLYASATQYCPPRASGIPSYFPSDMSISFDVSTEVEGDVLVRCRHLRKNGDRVTIFRAMFHTSFVADGLLRLQKQDLDNACEDKRVPPDFMVDFFFSSVEERGEDNERFWKSVEHRKVASPVADRLTASPGGASHSDSEEEKIDHALIEKYQKDLSESGDEEEDLSDYLSALESKGQPQ